MNFLRFMRTTRAVAFWLTSDAASNVQSVVMSVEDDELRITLIDAKERGSWIAFSIDDEARHSDIGWPEIWRRLDAILPTP